MTTPVILYSASGTPIGPAGSIRAIIQFYRPSSALDAAGLNYVAAAGPAFGVTANPVGSPIAVSELGIDFNSTTHKTTGRYGEDNNDPTVMRGSPSLNCGSFIQAQGQPTLMPGDYCELAIGMKISSTAATPVPAPTSRWVVTGDSIATSGPNKFSLKLELDRPNSDPALKEF